MDRYTTDRRCGDGTYGFVDLVRSKVSSSTCTHAVEMIRCSCHLWPSPLSPPFPLNPYFIFCWRSSLLTVPFGLALHLYRRPSRFHCRIMHAGLHVCSIVDVVKSSTSNPNKTRPLLPLQQQHRVIKKKGKTIFFFWLDRLIIIGTCCWLLQL